MRDGESRVHSATSAKHISGKQCVVVMSEPLHIATKQHMFLALDTDGDIMIGR